MSFLASATDYSRCVSKRFISYHADPDQRKALVVILEFHLNFYAQAQTAEKISSSANKANCCHLGSFSGSDGFLGD